MQHTGSFIAASWMLAAQPRFVLSLQVCMKAPHTVVRDRRPRRIIAQDVSQVRIAEPAGLLQLGVISADDAQEDVQAIGNRLAGLRRGDDFSICALRPMIHAYLSSESTSLAGTTLF
jgi:hypothetical protein